MAIRSLKSADDRQAVTLKLPAPAITTFDLHLTGTTPLILNAFGERAKAALALSMSGAAKQKKLPRNPQADFEASSYRLADGRYGIPKLAFRKAIQAGAMRMTEVKGTEALAAFQIDVTDDLLPLELEGEPRMRTDHVRHPSADLAYRPEFWPWSVTLPIKLDHEVLTIERFVHIVYKAGMGVGVGNWRPEKKGDFGTWSVDSISNVLVSEREDQ